MPRQKTKSTYSVYVASYANAEIKERVERGEEFITQPEQLTTHLFYLGTSERQAGYQFSRAARAALANPLASTVVMEKNFEVLVRFRIERR